MKAPETDVRAAPARRMDADPDAIPRRGSSFADLIAPVSPEEFFASYWENRALHVVGPPDGGTPLFTLRDLDHLVAQMPAEASVKLARASNGEGGSRVARAGATALPDLYRSYEAGDTVIVDGMHLLWGTVGELCRALTADLGMQVQANLYVTPRSAKGFPCHWDGHDVLILQLEGSKSWSVYPREVPLPRSGADGGAHDSATDPDLEVTLQPGHVLYIPRGTPHQGSTSAQPSVHLTLGLYAPTWEDLLLAMVESLASSGPDLRMALPHGWLRARAEGWPHADECRALVERLKSGGHVEQGLDALASQVAENAPCLPDGHFSQLGELDRITVESQVARPPNALLHASWRAGEAKLAFPGSFVVGPAKLFWAFQYIAASDRFRVADIPGWYSASERVMLVRVLVRAGCLRVVAPPSPDMSTSRFGDQA